MFPYFPGQNILYGPKIFSCFLIYSAEFVVFVGDFFSFSLFFFNFAFYSINLNPKKYFFSDIFGGL